MHLDNIWVYFDAHRKGHFEKRPLADKLPRNENSTLTCLIGLMVYLTTMKRNRMPLSLHTEPLPDKGLLEVVTI